MAQEVIYHKSLRFFPHWDQYESNQIIGFLNLVNYILSKRPLINNWLELGSFIGESANLVLGFQNILHLDCVDSEDNLVRLFKKKHELSIKNGRCNIHHTTTENFLLEIPNDFMDVVYIDANHKYDFVKKDIELSFIKLEKSGFLCGHDYSPEYNPFPGSNQAIEEFSKKQGLPIVRFIDNSWLMFKE